MAKKGIQDTNSVVEAWVTDLDTLATISYMDIQSEDDYYTEEEETVDGTATGLDEKTESPGRYKSGNPSSPYPGT